jgi:5S rRNA maturation endonuclease (ribonuclease M5)
VNGGYPDAIARLVMAARPLDWKRDGDQWKCRCPAHNDLKASLAVKLGHTGRPVLYCHAGCTADGPKRVLDAWGVGWEVLFPDEPEPTASNGTTPAPAASSSRAPRGEPEVVYDYTDEAGALLFQVCRFPGKDFRQRRPVQGGSWAWNLQHTRRVLYRLPDIVAQPSAVVWICEGEKDAERLRSLGLLATTNPGGAKKWRPEYSEALAGRQVVILPDNDEPGREHAARVAELLDRKAASVTVVSLNSLPEHGDVSDWLDAGHTVQELEQLRGAAAASPTVPTSPVSPATPLSPEQVRQQLLAGISTFTDLYKREFEAMRWTVYNLIADGCTLLVGSPKIGKSWLILAIALAVAAGDVALGRSTGKAGVLYLALEDSDRRLRSRLERLLGTAQPPEGLHYTTSWLPVSKGGLELLDRWLCDHPEVGLLIVDTLGAIKGEGARNGDAYSFDYSMAHALSQLARRHSCALVVVHHDRKATSEDWLHTVSGTLGLTGAADAILLLRRGRNEADGVLHTTGRDVPEQKLALRFADMRWQLLDGDADEYEIDSKRREILDVLRRAAKPMTARMVAEAVEGNREALKKMLRRMARDGLVALTDSGWSVPPQHSESGDVGTPGLTSSPPPEDVQTMWWNADNGPDAEITDPKSGGPASPDPQVANPCPKCGCEGREAGVSPTTFKPLSRCTFCDWTYQTPAPPTEPPAEESA